MRPSPTAQASPEDRRGRVIERVANLDAIARAIEPHGGRVLMPRARIPDVGDLLFFADPSGIVAGAMQYDRGLDG